MTDTELAVIEAARRCFGHTVDTETSETWMNGAIALWQVAGLADALRRLDGYPPYGKRLDEAAAARARRAEQGYAAWKASR